MHAVEIHVFAAASLAEALQEIGGAYAAATGDRPVFNLGASSMLARQIEAGAPADVFLSADEAKMNALAAKKLIRAETRRDLLSNTLVVVAAENAATLTRPADLAAPDVKKLALAEPQTVPAGIYAREFLTKLGLWEAVRARVLPCDNARAALATVEAGHAEAGIVYKTDAVISQKVRVAFEVAAASGPKIVYPGAVIARTKQPTAARKFLEHLAGADAQKVFARFGFLPPR